MIAAAALAVVLAPVPATTRRLRRLNAQILTVAGAPLNPRATIIELEQTAVSLLRDLSVQVLVPDEIHNILGGTWREQRVFSDEF